ncbi:MAG: phosphatidylserine decarboxylase family protein, partial [Flavobacteriales bacterium]
EGIKIIIISMLLIDAALVSIWFFVPWIWLQIVLAVGLLVFQFLIIWFFRVPDRSFTHTPGIVYAPADGKIVVIEKVFEPEYFKDQRIQVSIFMSPLNVHANYYPVSGDVNYQAYHKGSYLVAWHPKSSTENERTTIVVKSGDNEIMVRQIAGAVARRIVCYSKKGDKATSGEELGFIKFGSRVDVFLPLNAKVRCSINQISQGRLTEIASF